MKKILILLLLLTSSLTLSATLYAWDLNDQPIPELNNHTLREVFDVNNIIKDSYFNQPTYWTYVGESYYDSINKKGVLLSTTGAFTTLTKSNVLIINDTYYGNIQIDSITGIMTTETFNNIVYSTDGYKSFIETAKLSYYEIKRYGVSPVNAVLDNIYLINLTNLGISSLTVQQMDKYYSQYISRKNANYDLDDTKATNVLTIMQDFQDILLGTEDKKGFVDYVDDFLFKERTVGFSIEWLGIYYEWKFKPFYLLGTTLFVTLMGLVLVKKFVPVA